MSKFLDRFQNEIKYCDKANVFFISEYENGKISTRALAKANPCQNIYSVAKVYMVTAVGFLYDKGLLSLDEKLTDILRDELPDSYNKVWDEITLDMLLTHRVPLREGFLDIDCLDANEFGEDYLSYILNAPLREGYDLEKSTYTDAAFYLISRIVEKRAGMGTDTFLWKNLLFPTRCREAAFSKCPQGHVMGATGIYIRTDELVKLGSIYANSGMYEGMRILSEEFVNIVLSRHYELACLVDGVAYGKGGMRGQMIMVLPKAKKSVAWTGCGDNAFHSFVIKYHNKEN